MTSLPPGCQIVEFATKGDERGSLIALESGIEVPFEIRRVYTVFGTREGVARGFHAHRELKQMAVAVSGSCDMILDDGEKRERIRLDRPDRGLTLPPMIWHEMEHFSPDCVLMVLADDLYEEADYIRDYQAFLSLVRDGRA